MELQLLGREEELASIVELMRSPERLPRAVVLAGEAGIGKTALWLAGLEEAATRGFRVLRTRPNEAETRYSYAGLTDLLGGAADDVLPGLPPIQRRAIETALLLAEGDAAFDERAVASAVLAALRALAREGPVLVAADDVQWLDPASVSALRFALPRLESEPVASLVTVRGESPEWLRRGIPEQRLSVIELDGLSLGALHELLRDRIDARLPRPALVRIHETSAGNPFYALELARALERRGGELSATGELPLPPTLEELVDQRLDALPPDGTHVAAIVAMSADPSVELVEAVAGDEAEPGIAAGIAARVLEREGSTVRFVHPLLGSAVRARTGLEGARKLHGRLAELAPSAEERAHHLALATTQPNEEVASLLERESLAAHLRGAPATAAQLAEHAYRLTPPDDAAIGDRRLIVLAERLYDDHDDTRAVALLEEALEASPPGVARARVLTKLGAIKADVESVQAAVALYREALTQAEGDPAVETEIHLSLADLCRFTSGRKEGFEHARDALRSSSGVEDGALRCRALANYCLLHFSVGLGSAEAELEEALALERALGFIAVNEYATDVLVHQLFWTGELDAARRLLEAQRVRHHARSQVDEAGSLWYLALVEWRAGNWELAATYGARAVELREQSGREAIWPVTEYPRTTVMAHLGLVDEARERAERVLAGPEAGNPTAVSAYSWLLGFLDLSCGDADSALDHLRHSWRTRDENWLLEPGQRAELADTLEALVAVGELDEADARMAEVEERCRALDRARELAILARGRGLVAAARGDFESAFASYETALSEHARSTDPFQHARTLLALGTTQRRAKQRATARTTLQDALTRFEQLPARLWADKTRAELARIGGRAPTTNQLTEAEQRIARLVAQGKTNREVAATLFLTVHTVETALTRIYRKLGVRSRSELARVITE